MAVSFKEEGRKEEARLLLPSFQQSGRSCIGKERSESEAGGQYDAAVLRDRNVCFSSSEI